MFFSKYMGAFIVFLSLALMPLTSQANLPLEFKVYNMLRSDNLNIANVSSSGFSYDVVPGSIKPNSEATMKLSPTDIRAFIVMTIKTVIGECTVKMNRSQSSPNDYIVEIIPSSDKIICYPPGKRTITPGTGTNAFLGVQAPPSR